MGSTQVPVLTLIIALQQKGLACCRCDHRQQGVASEVRGIGGDPEDSDIINEGGNGKLDKELGQGKDGLALREGRSDEAASWHGRGWL